MDRMCCRRNGYGHQRSVDGSFSVEQTTRTHSPWALTESSRHSLVRTNPWTGAVGSSPLARNQGKQTGIPPRMARPSCQFECRLRKITCSAWAGCQDVRWAPCRNISAEAEGAVTRILGNPPLPETTSTTCGIPNSRFRASMCDWIISNKILSRTASGSGHSTGVMLGGRSSHLFCGQSVCPERCSS